MLRNYLKTALRSISRQKGSTIINISGLGLGIACSLVLFLLVMHLSSFDNFHAKKDRIYRIVNQSEGNQGTQYQSGVPSVLPDAFRNDFPEAKEVVFMSYRAGSLVTVPQRNGEPKKFQEEQGVVFTEPAFFKIFDRAVVAGDAQALEDPNQAMIARDLALKYFGKADVLGEIVKFADHEYRISAVMENPPANTDFPFTLMLSYVTIKAENEQKGWNSTWSDEQCYFLLDDDADVTAVEERMPTFTKKYLGEEDFDKTRFTLQPLKELHYDDRYGAYSYNTVPREMLFAFGIIALVLILTACINFINLSTAEAVKRSKEVGVRKSLGSTQRQLVAQFLGETTLITCIAVVCAVAIAQLLLSVLNPFLELQLSMDLTSNLPLWIYMISISVGVSLLAGLYPAFVLSGFKPALVLKNQMGNKNSSSYVLRRILVVAQFSISQLLIIVTIMIVSQMNYSTSKNLGFAKDAILVVPIPESEGPASGPDGASKMRTLRDQIASLAGVQHASLASTPPSSSNVSGTDFTIEGVEGEFGTQVKQIDGNYLDLYELELVSGKNIQDLDTAVGFLVNEKLMRTAGFHSAEEILGRNLRLWGKTYPVIGVLKDFHTVSLRQPIEATVLFNRIRGYETLALKVNMSNAESVINALRSKWEDAYPEHLFEFHFLDEQIREFYDGERKMSILIGSFTSMAIFIGCLGLFGLATFMANQKTKEIGVRKVLGASIPSILMMFSKEYVMLIFLGFVLAAPIGWLASKAFLSEFAYKITPGAGMFLTAFGITLLIAMVTVGYKSFRAAAVNPVKSLRYE